MIANFNNVEWGDLEDIVTRECDRGNKVSYFAGPIFRPSDPFFNELTSFVPAAERRRACACRSRSGRSCSGSKAAR